ncbi:hypothetical protein [Chryseolinea lacunae]|uniref:Uncharacterized protein n=1 Tax=Chryseolinea lacunae TaxID=2801331 RepID=A0ABS1L2N0_9BACT|nr:hypothetical protein [Chryseolinea lacunae]MBL0745945.1 hypothetical protein [Chryseolinea lacunae]
MRYIYILVLMISVHHVNAQTNSGPFSLVASEIDGPKLYVRLANDALKICNRVLNSDEFRGEVLRAKFDWEELGSYYFIPKAIPNDQVLNLLYSKSYTMKIEFKTGRGYNWRMRRMYGTYGITNLNVPETKSLIWWLNPTGDYKGSVRDYAAHIAHEYCHMRGFADKAKDPDDFQDVVPYSIGNIVNRLLQTGKFD